MLIIRQNELSDITLNTGWMPKGCCLATGNYFSQLRAEIIVKHFFYQSFCLCLAKTIPQLRCTDVMWLQARSRCSNPFGSDCALILCAIVIVVQQVFENYINAINSFKEECSAAVNGSCYCHFCQLVCPLYKGGWIAIVSPHVTFIISSVDLANLKKQLFFLRLRFLIVNTLNSMQRKMYQK